MWHVREHIIIQVSLKRRIQLEPFENYLARWGLRWRRQQNTFPSISLSFASHVPVLLGISQKASAET
jgi:hypothetical protein